MVPQYVKPTIAEIQTKTTALHVEVFTFGHRLITSVIAQYVWASEGSQFTTTVFAHLCACWC